MSTNQMALAVLKTVRPCSKCGTSDRKANGKCKVCTTAYQASYYARNADEAKAYAATHYKENLGSAHARHAAYRGENKDKIKAYCSTPVVRSRRVAEEKARRKDPAFIPKIQARLATRNAIRRGELKKGACEVCNGIKVDAHHDDYSKPLDVRWLCRVHHSAFHFNTGRIEK